MDGAMYFVTFRVQNGILDQRERGLVLNHIVSGDSKFYSLVACVVMPNHVHAVFLADQGYSLEQVMKGVKGASSRIVNAKRKSHGNLWQHESFDRIVRSEKELQGKLKYMLNNPVKAGLVDDGWSYFGWYCNQEFFQR